MLGETLGATLGTMLGLTATAAGSTSGTGATIGRAAAFERKIAQRPPARFSQRLSTDERKSAGLDLLTEAEMVRGFEVAHALGAKAICCSPSLGAVKKIGALAKQHQIRVAPHNHSTIAPDQLATAEQLAEVPRLIRHLK